MKNDNRQGHREHAKPNTVEELAEEQGVTKLDRSDIEKILGGAGGSSIEVEPAAVEYEP